MSARLRYEIAHPREIDPSDRAAINTLRERYLTKAVTGAPVSRSFRLGAKSEPVIEDLHEFAERTGGKSFDNPNKDSGPSKKRNPRVVVARNMGYETTPVVGYAYVADDASGRTGLLRPVGAVEKLAKLHVPFEPFIGSRFLWFREIVVPPIRVGLDNPMFYSLVALSTHAEHVEPTRPTSMYLFPGETSLAGGLKSLGMEERGEPSNPEPIFPGANLRLSLQAYEGKVGEVHAAAMTMHGVRGAVEETLERLRAAAEPRESIIDCP